MPQPRWYDPETDPSPFMAALWKVRHLCTRAEHVRMTVPGGHMLVQAIMSAIDDYAERETGNREYFQGKPHKAGYQGAVFAGRVVTMRAFMAFAAEEF